VAVSRRGRRTKIIAGAVAVLACLAALASYLYLRYVDVARFSAEHGRITVDAAPAGTAPGPADGQGADDDGGYWYVMRPSGQIVGN